jgi:hypothetical protein
MNRTLPVTLLCFTVWLTAGCVINANNTDDDPQNPFVGTYKVTSHTQNEADCNGPGTAVMDGDLFFSLKEESLFGVPFLAYRACTDATTCADSASLFESFIDEGKGWVREIKTSSGTGPCALSLTEGPLVETETGLSLESRTSSATVELVGDEKCDTDLVDTRRSELQCTGIEFLAADKL